MNRRQLRDAVLAVAIGFGLGSAVVAANDLRNSSRGELLGAVDFFKYCIDTNDEESTATQVVNNAHGWRCVVQQPVFDFVLIDFDAACTHHWGVPAEARTDDDASPYGWRCYRA